ncbi:MAG: AAA family ATPase [Clostridia bacterium]|nr:AAA family ATPase [Clostridia bacterium]
MLTNELIRKTILEGKYIPSDATDHMTTQEFRDLYGCEVLKKYTKGKELLHFLFGNIEHNSRSLTYSLEVNTKITSFFGAAAPGFNTTKILNHSKGSWKNRQKNITEDEAIDIAYNIRTSLIAVFEKITDDTNAVEIYDLLRGENLESCTNQNWFKKYLTILYPDKFMLMLNEDWTSRIFVPLGLKVTGNWFKDARTFSEMAKEFNLDSVNFYHVIYKCAIEQVKQELSGLGIDPGQLAAPSNLLVNKKNAWKEVKKHIKSEEIQSKFEEYLSKKYDWDLKTKKSETMPSDKIEMDKTDVTNIKYLNEYSELVLDSKNIIFRGAPGTGKTYLAKSIAADIVSRGKKSKYGDLSDEEEKQVGFVQFHPSYDYSDFVEGLRPVEKNGVLGFELRNGVFKEFVEHAKKNFVNSQKSQVVIEKEQSIEERMTDFLETAVDGEEFETRNGNKFYITGYDDQYIQIYIPSNEISNSINIKIDEIKSLLAAEQEFGSVREIRSFFNKKHNTQGHSYVYVIYKSIVDRGSVSRKTVVKKEELKNYVFIIDEINRGEISKILGELFYSIEPGYRGTEGAVFTQYSNLHDDPEEKFYIPENVYIIGTMNDIDRSVDTFDFAMRRRFRFVEIDADKHMDMLNKLNDELLKEEAKKRMRSLNAVIAKTDGLGKNYQIGASYFLKLETVDFEHLWLDYLEPLLQEYVTGAYNEKDIMSDFYNAYNLVGEGRENENEN